MKRYFLTGLAIILPLAFTLAVVIFLFNILTEPFVGIVKGVMLHYGILENGFLFLSADQIQKLVSQVLVLVMLFGFIIGIGMIARWFFFHSIIRLGEYIFHQIPIVRSIYKTTKDVIQTIFASDTRSFKQVALVPFPNAHSRCIGLVTRENLEGFGEKAEERVAVFVPTTPNPTSGFLVIYKQSEITYLDMTVEDAFKYVISCGVILSPFKTVTRKEAREILKREDAEDHKDSLE